MGEKSFEIDFWQRTPMLVVAGWRTGGTYLCSCLDSHPDIACVRDEPLNPKSPWQYYIGEDKVLQIITLLWEQVGYRVNGFKATYWQYDTLRSHWGLKGVKVIHLMRGTVDTVISRYISDRRENDPEFNAHTYSSIPLKAIEIEPGAFVRRCEKLIAERNRIKKRLLDDLDHSPLELWYEDITQPGTGFMPAQPALEICDHLAVAEWALYSSTRPTSACYERHERVANWSSIRQRLLENGIPETYHGESYHMARAN
jgi:hypothetical protein